MMIAKTDDLRWLSSIWRRAATPQPQLDVDEWADNFRVLPAQSSEPGPWRTERTPYLRGIMKALSVSDPHERVVVMGGSQVGKTEIGLNWLGYIIDHMPGTTLFVMPSLDAIRRNTPLRVDPLIDATPVLRNVVVNKKSREAGNSAFRKSFPGGDLFMVTASSGIGLRSTPARYLFLDEVDAFPGDVDDEGDPIELAIQRTVTFGGRRKIYMCSTPTIKSFSRIEKSYLESDQRIFMVPCRQCGEFSEVKWENIRWPEHDRARAAFVCPMCGFPHEERDKPGLLAAGEWRATAPGDGITAGFRLPGLLSPFETWGSIAIQHGKVKSDPVRLKTWVNNKLAETFEDLSGDTIDTKNISDRGENWGSFLPSGVVVITCGIDVQPDRLELEIVGWGRGEESYSLEYRRIHGSPDLPGVWAELDDILARRFPHSRAVPDLPILAACVDTGGANTNSVYAYVRNRQENNVWAIKGASKPGQQIWPRKPSYENKGRVPLYMIGTDTAKDAIYSRLAITDDGPGKCHFPSDREDEYFKSLTIERVRTKYVKGRPVREWVKPQGARNEALDCRVYAYAALNGLIVSGAVDLDRQATLLAQYPPRDSDAPPPAAIGAEGRKRVVARFNFE